MEGKGGREGWLTGFTVGFVGRSGFDEVRDCGFEGVVGSEDVDVDYRFEGVGAELVY